MPIKLTLLNEPPTKASKLAFRLFVVAVWGFDGSMQQFGIHASTTRKACDMTEALLSYFFSTKKAKEAFIFPIIPYGKFITICRRTFDTPLEYKLSTLIVDISIRAQTYRDNWNTLPKE